MTIAEGGEFLLRIEDIDKTRALPEWEEQIYDDLRWLGLSWKEPVMRQLDRLSVYSTTLKKLWDNHLVFACTCNRRDIFEAANAPQEREPVYGPDGLVYPGTCRQNKTGWDNQPMPDGTAYRLDMSMAIHSNAFSHRIDTPQGGWHFVSQFVETGRGPNAEHGLIEFSADDMETKVGDVVLARRDIGTSYHLSVVLDDAEQEITHVVRGEDLFEATKIHVVLQRVLGLSTPTYHHHKLIRDTQGKRLAKRDDARAISKYRQEGATPDDIRRMVGLSP